MSALQRPPQTPKKPSKAICIFLICVDWVIILIYSAVMGAELAMGRFGYVLVDLWLLWTCVRVSRRLRERMKQKD